MIISEFVISVSKISFKINKPILSRYKKNDCKNPRTQSLMI
jgi:hypothetical protein